MRRLRFGKSLGKTVWHKPGLECYTNLKKGLQILKIIYTCFNLKIPNEKP